MLRLFVTLAALVGVAAPAFAAEAPTEVMHFWVSGSERAAVDTIKRSFEQHGGRWVDNAQANALELRHVLTERLTTGTAPTALQWQGGSELREMAEIGLIENFDDLALRHHWDDVLSDAVKSRIKYDGHYFLAPTGVHSENWIFYNTKVLRDHGLSAPKSFDELLQAADKLEQAGVTPISLGKSDWEARVILTSILTSKLGKVDFKALVEKRDTSVLDKPAALEAMKLFYDLYHHVGPDGSRPAGWAEATAAVGDGRAAFIFQGDWAKGELKKLGHHVDADFGCILVPGTENLLSVVVDAFAFPRSLSPVDGQGRDKFIEAVLAPDVQVAFNEVKGSVPVRTDLSDSQIDSCAATAAKLLREPDATMSQPAQIMSTAMVSDLHILVHRMMAENPPTPEQALKEFKALFPATTVESVN